MKISGIITNLQSIQDEIGDVDVYGCCGIGGSAETLTITDFGIEAGDNNAVIGLELDRDIATLYKIISKEISIKGDISYGV